MQHIPLELLDRFIEELYDDPSKEGQTTLNSCILVSKHFRHRALKHLAENVQVICTENNRASARHMANLRQIIVSPPNSSLKRVGAYIKSLHIHWLHIMQSPLPVKYNIVAILRELHGEDYAIRHLGLEIGTGTQTSIPWIEIAPSFRKHFELLATSPRLESLTIIDAESLPPLIVTGRSLKKLHLECEVGPGLSEYSTAQSLPYPPELEEVFIDHSHTFHHCSSPPRFSKLKKMVATNTRPQDFPKIWNMLCTASDTVEYITILQSFSELILDSHLDNIGQFPNLKHLDFSHVRSSRMRHMSSNELSVNNIFQLFNVNRVMKNVDVISLRLEFSDFMNPGNFLESKLEIGWDRLDEILAGPFYPSLSQVTVNVDAYYSLESRCASTLAEQLKERLPRLSTSDRIEFELIVKAYYYIF